jgi:hypothetical protein
MIRVRPAQARRNEQKVSPTIMNIKTAAATLAGAILIAGSPVLASAATYQASPIRLDSVNIAPSAGIHNNFAYTGLVNVAFTNESPVAITQVVFDIEAGGKVIDRISDTGSYAQGVTVKHSFPDIQTNLDQQLAVESVSFADGTSWSNTDQVAPLRQAAQAKSESAEQLFPLFPYETE